MNKQVQLFVVVDAGQGYYIKERTLCSSVSEAFGYTPRDVDGVLWATVIHYDNTWEIANTNKLSDATKKEILCWVEDISNSKSPDPTLRVTPPQNADKQERIKAYTVVKSDVGYKIYGALTNSSNDDPYRTLLKQARMSAANKHISLFAVFEMKNGRITHHSTSMDDPEFKQCADWLLNKLGLSIPAETKTPDLVNSPSHYTDGKIEVIDFIEDKQLTYHLGNAVKYISRAGKKDPAKHIEDLQKAAWYLNREIQRLSK